MLTGYYSSKIVRFVRSNISSSPVHLPNHLLNPMRKSVNDISQVTLRFCSLLHPRIVQNLSKDLCVRTFFDKNFNANNQNKTTRLVHTNSLSSGVI